MQPNYFEQAIQRILEEDARFSPYAYCFLQEALDIAIEQTTQKNQRLSHKKPRHITGQELVTYLQRLALDKYGPLAYTVLTSWGITRWKDFGDIVYALIGQKILQKNEQDSELDFETEATLEDILCVPFLPPSVLKHWTPLNKAKIRRKRSVAL